MRNLIKRIYTSLFLLLILYLSLTNMTILFITVLVLNFTAIREFYAILNKIFKKKLINNFIFSLLFVIYMATFSLIVWLHLFPENILGVISFIFVLMICVASDIGGFVFGKIFGGRNFTKISPNKTYSGVLGSYIFSLSSAYLFNLSFGNFLVLEINILIFVFIISTASQLGDLIISFFKRKAKIKDTGSILPGHGGILDRVVGVLFAVPLGIVLISI